MHKHRTPSRSKACYHYLTKMLSKNHFSRFCSKKILINLSKFKPEIQIFKTISEQISKKPSVVPP